jgi:hypothetical protein
MIKRLMSETEFWRLALVAMVLSAAVLALFPAGN